MTEKKTKPKAQPIVEAVNEAMNIVATASEFCDVCGTLTHLCICQYRGNEIYDCDCVACPCMQSVAREGAICADCKAHE